MNQGTLAWAVAVMLEDGEHDGLLVFCHIIYPVIPNLQYHPMIGFDFLAQAVSSIEELKQVEKIKASLPGTTSIR